MTLADDLKNIYLKYLRYYTFKIQVSYVKRIIKLSTDIIYKCITLYAFNFKYSSIYLSRGIHS